jgi:hypothetical protein
VHYPWRWTSQIQDAVAARPNSERRERVSSGVQCIPVLLQSFVSSMMWAASPCLREWLLDGSVRSPRPGRRTCSPPKVGRGPSTKNNSVISCEPRESPISCLPTEEVHLEIDESCPTGQNAFQRPRHIKTASPSISDIKKCTAASSDLAIYEFRLFAGPPPPLASRPGAPTTSHLMFKGQDVYQEIVLDASRAAGPPQAASIQTSLSAQDHPATPAARPTGDHQPYASAC